MRSVQTWPRSIYNSNCNNSNARHARPKSRSTGRRWTPRVPRLNRSALNWRRSRSLSKPFACSLPLIRLYTTQIESRLTEPLAQIASLNPPMESQSAPVANDHAALEAVRAEIESQQERLATAQAEFESRRSAWESEQVQFEAVRAELEAERAGCAAERAKLLIALAEADVLRSRWVEKQAADQSRGRHDVDDKTLATTDLAALDAARAALQVQSTQVAGDVSGGAAVEHGPAGLDAPQEPDRTESTRPEHGRSRRESGRERRERGSSRRRRSRAEREDDHEMRPPDPPPNTARLTLYSTIMLISKFVLIAGLIGVIYMVVTSARTSPPPSF